MFLKLSAIVLLLLSGCGGDGGDAGTTSSPTTEAPSCPPAGPDDYSGTTSEDLCVTIERDASGKISTFEIEILATCTVGFGESGVVLSTETETLTTSEAAPNPGEPFEASVSMRETPIEVDASGAFESGNLTGTVTDTDAEGSYQLDFTAQLVDEISCTGGPVTWSASRAD
jgi:hypothetical protein